jgi:hypothetical protein
MSKRQSNKKIYNQRYCGRIIQKRSLVKQSFRILCHSKVIHKNAILYWMRNSRKNSQSSINLRQKNKSPTSKSAKRCFWKSCQKRRKMINTDIHLLNLFNAILMFCIFLKLILLIVQKIYE